MSGIDEQVPECRCSKCGGTNFYKVSYGAITTRIDTEEGTYREGTYHENDREDWQCNDCYLPVTSELKVRIMDLEVELS